MFVSSVCLSIFNVYLLTSLGMLAFSTTLGTDQKQADFLPLVAI